MAENKAGLAPVNLVQPKCTQCTKASRELTQALIAMSGHETNIAAA